MEESTPKKSVNESVTAAEPRIKSVSPDEIAEEVASGQALVVDVREPEEWQEGHIPGAINIPYGWLESKVDPASTVFDPRIRPDKSLCINCATGRRSALATATLNDMGYEKAINLEGGFEGWKAAGYPVERTDESGEKEEPGSAEVESEQQEMELDLRGSICPGPTADTLAALKKLPPRGKLAVISDYLPARQTIPRLVKQRRCSWRITEDDGRTFRMEIRKGGE
jgi:rhodanese-related sulfurtransferase/TusA-related sulfurtransferase